MHWFCKFFCPMVEQRNIVSINKIPVLLFADDIKDADNALREAMPVVSASGRTFLKVLSADSDDKSQAGRFWMVPSSWQVLRSINGKCEVLMTDSPEYVIVDTREIKDAYLSFKTDDDFIRVIDITKETDEGCFNGEELDRFMTRKMYNEVAMKLRKESGNADLGSLVPSGLPLLERTKDGYEYKSNEGGEAWIGLLEKRSADRRSPRDG